MHPSDSNQSHPTVQQLLPWYINQTLSYQQHQLVEQHLKHCLVCRRDWQQLQQLAEQIVAPGELEAAASASFARLREQLPHRPTVSAVQPAKPRHRWLIAASGLGIAASLLLLINPLSFVAVGVLDAPAYQTLSIKQPEPSNGHRLKVVFAPHLSPETKADWLAEIHGQTVNEANSMGALTIQLPANSPINTEQALSLLRNHSGVLLAEPTE